MNGLALPLAVLIALLANGERVQAAEGAVVPIVSTTASELYPQVTCTTSDGAACADALQLAADTREQLTPLLKLGTEWRFPVHIHIVTADDPLSEKIYREGVSAVAVDKTMEIYAFVPPSDPEGREFIQRQYVTALLWEKFFAGDQSFDDHTRLDLVPLWLIEGLREWLNDDPEHNREGIVKRAAQSQRAPTLAEITNWQDLSGDRLLGLWQRAFSYYLVKSLVRTAEQRENFQQWLASVTDLNPSAAKLLFPTEADWQRELLDATGRSHDIVYTWDETAAELADAETFALAAPGSDNVRICTLDEVTRLPRDDILIEALTQKNSTLTALELRAHASWRPILDLYRFGLSALASDKDPERARQFLAQARLRRDDEIAYHQKLIDYVNWFEVTHDYASATTRFRSYFLTAREAERAQAREPNPIRAHLLQVESQL